MYMLSNLIILNVNVVKSATRIIFQYLFIFTLHIFIIFDEIIKKNNSYTGKNICFLYTEQWHICVYLFHF